MITFPINLLIAINHFKDEILNSNPKINDKIHEIGMNLNKSDRYLFPLLLMRICLLIIQYQVQYFLNSLVDLGYR